MDLDQLYFLVQDMLRALGLLLVLWLLLRVCKLRDNAGKRPRVAITLTVLIGLIFIVQFVPTVYLSVKAIADVASQR